MIIDHIGRKVKYFSEPSDFPYLHTLAPEAVAASSDVPVGQFVRVVADRTRAFGDFIFV